MVWQEEWQPDVNVFISWYIYCAHVSRNIKKVNHKVCQRMLGFNFILKAMPLFFFTVHVFSWIPSIYMHIHIKFKLQYFFPLY